MPEGHTIHRLARLHRSALVGHPVATSSPQGRFAQGAAVLDGRVLNGVEPHGKHLFYRWEGLAEALHIHLGLIGKLRTHRNPPPAPGAATRLRMSGPTTTIDLSGPMVCALIEPDRQAAIRSRLGPDPLRRADDPERAYAALRRRRVPIAAALLDQSIIAGIGNVYRAEALFVCGIDPLRRADDLSRAEVEGLYATLRAMLRAGERSGRIVTVEPDDVGVRTRREVPVDERTYVYGRHGRPCRRCGTPVATLGSARRRLFWCPTCQADKRG